MARFSSALGRARVNLAKSKNPDDRFTGVLFWRRPTLARPVAVLPSGLQRFTSVFGMGTGGTATLLSPELNGEFLAAQFW
jgi:hypothetical protein